MSPKSAAPAAIAPGSGKQPTERLVRDIRRSAHNEHSAEQKIWIVPEGLHGEDSIAALCRRKGIAESLYYAGSTGFSKPASGG